MYVNGLMSGLEFWQNMQWPVLSPRATAHSVSGMDESELQQLLQQRLPLGNGEVCWKLGSSQFGDAAGRGLLAARPIPRGQLVYADRALLLGPRSHERYLPLCAVCHRADCELSGCEYGCGLPVCSQACARSTDHLERECAYLRRLRPLLSSPGSWNLDLVRALVALRALFLNPAERRLLLAVQAHEAPRHAREVDLLKRSLAGSLAGEDEQLMRRACQAMDTNCFETAMLGSGSSASTSLRALFPLGALTNHQCVPNTRHLVNANGELLVYASRNIDQGQEISMTYSELLWDSPMRRRFLRATKHFSCQCPRCSDPTEHGSMLAALKCATAACQGLLLPDRALDDASPWSCNHCRLTIGSKQIASIRAGIATALQETAHQTPRKLLRFMQRELALLVPQTNYFMMDLMFRIVSLFGRVQGLTWKDLTDDEVDAKIDYCNKLIQCLDTLNCGDCTKKGLILYELYLANVEKQQRLASHAQDNLPTRYQLSPAFNQQHLLQALYILKDDILAPSDYRQLYALKSATNCLETPIATVN